MTAAIGAWLLKRLADPRLWAALGVAGGTWLAYDWAYGRGAAAVQREWEAAKAQARAARAEQAAAAANAEAEQAQTHADIAAQDAAGAIAHVESDARLERDPAVLRGRLERLCHDAASPGAADAGLPAAASVPAPPAGARDAGRQRPGADAAEPVPAPDGLAGLAVEAPRCVTCCDRLAELQAAVQRREALWEEWRRQAGESR